MGVWMIDLKSAVNRSALDYYLERIVDGRLPSRSDIDPISMRAFLSHVILVDVLRDPALDFRFRLVGTYYQDFWSNDPTGKTFRECLGTGPGSTIWSALEETTEAKTPRTTTIKYVGPLKDIYDVEDCVMPLSTDGDTVDMFLVTCEYMAKK